MHCRLLPHFLADGPIIAMPDVNATERFVQQLLGAQDRISTYIAMLLGNPALVNDVLQETNLVLWRKAAEFDESRDFGAWACGIARFQVLAYVRDLKRDRHHFDEDLVQTLAGSMGSIVDELDPRSSALSLCLEKLTDAQRSVLKARYTDNEPVGQLADSTGRSAASITKQLCRIRQVLLECIQRRLAAEGDS